MGLSATGPDCPSCGAWITKVILTRANTTCDELIRRRHCHYCDHRFYTRQVREEIVDVKWVPGANGKSTIPKVIKVYDTPFKGRAAA